jgi:hypothetical protein
VADGVRRRTACRAAADRNDAPPPAPYPSDGLTLAFIAACRRAYGRLAGWQSPRRFDDAAESYAGMVEVSRALLRSRRGDPAAARDAVIAGLPRVPAWFRRLFPATRWGAALNARVTPLAFAWLVGPARVVSIDIDGAPLPAGVEIPRCRYLDEAGCAAMCVNLCQQPVQTFFTQELGMPLTMAPNFADGSCLMSFGVPPPSVDADPAASSPCLAGCGTLAAGEGGLIGGRESEPPRPQGEAWTATPVEGGGACGLLQESRE